MVNHVSHLRGADVDVAARLDELDPYRLAGHSSPAHFVADYLGPLGPGTRTSDAALNRWLTGMEGQIRTRPGDVGRDQVPPGRDLDRLRTAWNVTAAPVATSAPSSGLDADAERTKRVQAHLERTKNGGTVPADRSAGPASAADAESAKRVQARIDQLKGGGRKAPTLPGSTYPADRRTRSRTLGRSVSGCGSQ